MSSTLPTQFTYKNSNKDNNLPEQIPSVVVQEDNLVITSEQTTTIEDDGWIKTKNKNKNKKTQNTKTPEKLENLPSLGVDRVEQNMLLFPLDDKRIEQNMLLFPLDDKRIEQNILLMSLGDEQNILLIRPKDKQEKPLEYHINTAVDMNTTISEEKSFAFVVSGLKQSEEQINNLSNATLFNVKFENNGWHNAKNSRGNRNFQNNSNNRRFDNADQSFGNSDDRRFDNTNQSFRNSNNRQVAQQEAPPVDGKKKSFTAVQEKTEKKVKPDYYIKPLIKEFNDPQAGEDIKIHILDERHVPLIGALEKNPNYNTMVGNLVSLSVIYYDRNAKQNDKLAHLISTDPLQQEKLMELIILHSLSILLHRLVKSCNYHIIKTILENGPIYGIVSDKFNHNKNQPGHLAYARLRGKYIDNCRIAGNGQSTEANKAARLKIKETQNFWLLFMIQSVWNGNNIIHDCGYYGALDALTTIFGFMIEHKMEPIMKRMMIKPNNQQETFETMINGGIVACKNKQQFNIVREKQYRGCLNKYHQILKYVESATMNHQIVEPIEQKKEDKTNGDNINICSLHNDGNIEGMIEHIKQCAENKQFSIIHKTMDLWKATAEKDTSGNLKDYITDVEYSCKSELQQYYSDLNSNLLNNR